MPRYLDLFAGAGGLSEGFFQAGYTPVVHIEMNEAACYTLKTRAAYHWLEANGKLDLYDAYLRQEISRQKLYQSVPEEILEPILKYEISDNTIPEIFKKVDAINEGQNIDLIIGGPPCQAYSVAGRSRSDMSNDSRNYLYRLYAKFLEKYRPQFFVFENVTGLLSAKDKDGTLHFDNMRNLFRNCGYNTVHRVLNAHDYGVLQNRKRVILIGKRTKKDFDYPFIPIESDDNIKVGELFKDLPSIKAGGGAFTPQKTKKYNGRYLYDVGIKNKDRECVSLHCARPNTSQDLQIYRLTVEAWDHKHHRIHYSELPANLRTHKNIASFQDRFKVVAGDLPFAQTVVAHIAKDGHYYIHPDVRQNRSITPREAARLQTFPDNYYFESSKDAPGRTEAFKQIGNAVPVRLAYNIAKSLRCNWD